MKQSFFFSSITAKIFNGKLLTVTHNYEHPCTLYELIGMLHDLILPLSYHGVVW